MRLSKNAQDYHRLICNQRVDEINKRFRAEVKQLISRFEGKPYLAHSRNKAAADTHIKYWEDVVKVRIEAFIEAYELENYLFDDDDIENLLQELQSDSRKNWIAELISQEKNESGRIQINFGFSLPWPEILKATIDTRLSMHRKVREKLFIVMKQKVLHQIESRILINAPIQGSTPAGEAKNEPDGSSRIDPKFDEAIDSLLELINHDTTLDKYQKEDAIDALKKLPDLAKETQTENVIKRARDKLEVFNSIISIRQDLAVMAAPYLPVIAEHFHLLS